MPGLLPGYRHIAPVASIMMVCMNKGYLCCENNNQNKLMC